MLQPRNCQHLQLVNVQARDLPPFECGASLQRVGAHEQGGLRSVFDAQLLRYVPGFLADMDAALQQPRVSALHLPSRISGTVRVQILCTLDMSRNLAKLRPTRLMCTMVET